MTFSYTFSCEDVSKITSSGKRIEPFEYNTTKWHVCFKVVEFPNCKYLTGILYGYPKSGVFEDTLFRFEASCKTTIKSYKPGLPNYIREEKHAVFEKYKAGQLAFSGIYIFFENLEEVKSPDYFLMKNDKMRIKININIQNVDKIHDFPFYNFSRAEPGSDVVLRIGLLSLHCHSQILMLHSMFFQEEIKKAKLHAVSKEIIGNKSGNRTELEVHIELDDRISYSVITTFLTVLYSAHRGLINEYNVKYLLELNDVWRSKLVHSSCEDFLLEHVKNPKLSSEEITVMAWQYSLDTLKTIIINSFTKYSQLRKLYRIREYLQLPDLVRLDLCETIINQICHNKNKID